MTGREFLFTYQRLRSYYKKALDKGYRFTTCLGFRENKKPDPTIVNRVDVDFSLKKADALREIFDDLGVAATFFIRLHAPEYNPLSFESYRIIKRMITAGHEIGLHCEPVDQAAIWSEDPADCLRRDIAIMQEAFGVTIRGAASHGGMTGLNNLEFWKTRKPSDFDLLYEAYDTEPEFDLFDNSFYISDSEWTQWKCYKNGALLANDHRTFGEHLDSDHRLIYLLVHPDTYFVSHFYE